MPLLCALFVLVLSTATASAECTWILWASSLLPSSGEEIWGVIGAYSRESCGEAGCEKSAEKWTKRAPSGGAAARRGPVDGVETQWALESRMDARPPARTSFDTRRGLWARPDRVATDLDLPLGASDRYAGRGDTDRAAQLPLDVRDV